MTNTWHFLICESFLGSFCLRSKVTSSSSSSSRSFSQSFFKRLMRPWILEKWAHVMVKMYVNWINATTLLPSATISQKFQNLAIAEQCWTSGHIMPYLAWIFFLISMFFAAFRSFFSLSMAALGFSCIRRTRLHPAAAPGPTRSPKFFVLTPNMAVALLIACFLSAKNETFFGWTRSAKLQGVHEFLKPVWKNCTQKWLRGSFGVTISLCKSHTVSLKKSFRK